MSLTVRAFLGGLATRLSELAVPPIHGRLVLSVSHKARLYFSPYHNNQPKRVTAWRIQLCRGRKHIFP